MEGTTGSFAVNGVTLLLQPSSSNWVGREKVGLDGNNRPIYPAVREYEMSWELMSTSELAQLIDVQLASVTGTVVADLPKWGDSTYTFHSYSGTVAREPVVGSYFVDYVTDVKMTFGRVRTN